MVYLDKRKHILPFLKDSGPAVIHVFHGGGGRKKGVVRWVAGWGAAVSVFHWQRTRSVLQNLHQKGRLKTKTKKQHAKGGNASKVKLSYHLAFNQLFYGAHQLSSTGSFWTWWTDWETRGALCTIKQQRKDQELQPCFDQAYSLSVVCFQHHVNHTNHYACLQLKLELMSLFIF